MNNSLKNKKILLIVTGGIASYKVLDLIRRLQDEKAVVECILTESAKEFINVITFESLLGKKVHSNLFSLTQEKEMSHIKLANEIDVILVIPCTANFLAKMANGIADDLASNIILASDKIKVIAPAMNSKMWSNDAVKNNLKTLSKMNIKLFSPKKGRLACGTRGTGKLMEVNNIMQKLVELFTPKDLQGYKVIVTAGASVEKIDPVRYISNFSSGIQGYEIAKSLSSLGAKVTLIKGNTKLENPNNVKVLSATTALDFLEKIEYSMPCDVIICAAAISDWKAKKVSLNKIKKNGKDKLNLTFSKNIDVLEKISKHPSRPRLIVGFSAETSDLIVNTKSKLKRKGCDWMIANSVANGEVFGSDYNKVSFISNEKVEHWSKMSKNQVSKKIAKKIVNFLKKNKLD